MNRIGCVLALVLLGGIAVAGPFSQRHPMNRVVCSGASCQALAPSVGVPEAAKSQPSTMQSPEYKPEEAPVPQPWLQISAQDGTSSQPPSTVLEPVQGTGLKLPIGPKVPDKVTHTLDESSLKALQEMLKGLSSSSKQPVSIALPIEPETSQRLSRISTILEWLLMLGAGYFGLSKTGGVLQWVARVVSGLPSVILAQSQAQAATAAAMSSAQANPSQAVNQAAQSSTPRPSS